jgi:uncharacterized protein
VYLKRWNGLRRLRAQAGGVILDLACLYATMKVMKAEVRHILDELRAGLEPLYADRLANIVLYGSQARGDATEESDIDVLLVLRGKFRRADEMKRTSQLIADLSLKYDTLISRQFVSEDDYVGARTPLLLNVRREGTAI